MAAGLHVCRGPTAVAESPCSSTRPFDGSQHGRTPSILARRGAKRCCARPFLAVTCQAQQQQQQQQQQPAAVDDAQRSRKLGRFSAKVGPCLYLQEYSAADLRQSMVSCFGADANALAHRQTSGAHC